MEIPAVKSLLPVDNDQPVGYRDGMKHISYLRVSTERQGRSGLGLEAQRDSVAKYLNGRELIAEFVETESGRNDERPVLRKALAACKREKATLVVAKLDRLARSVHLISGLMESGVKFVVCDLPEANELTLHIMAAFAQHEARRISERTRDALAAAKRRGKRLGCPVPHIGAAAGRDAIDQRVTAYRSRVLPVVEDIRRREGATTLREIAASLTARAVRTPRGSTVWGPSQVANLLTEAA